MLKTKASAENQPVPPPSSFHHHIIGLTRSPTLECFLYTSCSSKDQNSEANKKRWERIPVDRICRLCRDTQRTQTPMPPCSSGKPHRLASKRMSEPPQHTRDPPPPSRAIASVTGINLFPLEGKISNIGQPVWHRHREYNTIMTPKTCQYNQSSSAMVKTVHSFLRVPGLTPRHWGFFGFIRPQWHKRYKWHTSRRVPQSDGDGERSHRYKWHKSHRVPRVRWSHEYTWHTSHRVPQVRWR
jgi:rubredoxin